MKIWIAFFLICITSFTLSFVFNSRAGALETSILRQILINFLPFFPAYYFAKKGILTKKHLILFLLLLLPILSINFIYSSSNLKYEIGKEDVVSNAIYPIIGLLPFVFLISRRITSFGFIFFISWLAIQSNKRAAIIVCLITLVLFVYQNIYLSSRKKKIWNYTVACFFAIIAVYFLYNLYQQDPYLQFRINSMLEGDSASRDIIIIKTFDAWVHSNSFTKYLFGLGFNATYTVIGHASHNDWIDVLASYGLIGFILFSALWINLTKLVFKNDWYRPKKINYILVLMIAFLSSLVFRWYGSPFPFMNVILLPYLLATKNNDS